MSNASSPQPPIFDIQQKDVVLEMSLKGEWTTRTVASIWSRAIETLSKHTFKQVQVECSGVSAHDGSLLGLFADIRRLAAQQNAQVTITGLSPEFAQLAEVAAFKDPSIPQLRKVKPAGFISTVGRFTAGLLEDFYAMVSFLGRLLAAFWYMLRHPKTLRIADWLAICDRVGSDAVPVLSLLGLLIGMILAFQTAVPLSRLGGAEFIPAIVAIATVRELGPLIAAILVAGRTGAAFAAEIGTMKVTEELSALEVLGLDPVRFLVVPRVLATMVMLPLLSAFCILMSIVGGYLVMSSRGFTLIRYIQSVEAQITAMDLTGGLAKTLVFGFLVAGIGCLSGMRTASGPGAVGASTTKAVVSGIVLIVMADGVLGMVYYALGI